MLTQTSRAMGKTEGTSTSLEEFCPERYLDGEEKVDPYDFVFGFGRRVCPGRHLADSSLFLMFASMLATFNISPQTSTPPGAADVPKFTTHLIR